MPGGSVLISPRRLSLDAGRILILLWFKVASEPKMLAQPHKVSNLKSFQYCRGFERPFLSHCFPLFLKCVQRLSSGTLGIPSVLLMSRDIFLNLGIAFQH